MSEDQWPRVEVILLRMVVYESEHLISDFDPQKVYKSFYFGSIR